MPNLGLTRKTLVLAKTEATPGTPESSLVATGATPDTMLLFGSGAMFQLDTKMVKKEALRASLTPQKQLVGRRLYTVDPTTVLMSKASGGATGYPWFRPLLKACGLAEASAGTVTSGSTGSWTYTPKSSSFDSATIWIYADGLLHKVGGALGTFSVDLMAGEAPDMTFNLTGTLAAEPAASAFPASPVYPTNTMKMVESLSLLLGSYAPVCRSIKFTQGMGKTERGDVNSSNGFKGIHLPSRDGVLEIVIERDSDLATKNFYAIQKAATVETIGFTHGADSQSAIVFSATGPQLGPIREGDDGGIPTWTLTYYLQHGTDDGEWSWAFKEKNP